jgi:hypothetical protein
VVHSGRLRDGIWFLLLVGAAGAIFVADPWHGPIVLSLSSSHGVDAGDLPALALLALALGAAHRLTRGIGMAWRGSIGRWAPAASAVALGGLLFAVLFLAPHPRPSLPAGGGTFDGTTGHADSRQTVPVGQWSHLAMTYDGAAVRLFIDGDQVASRPTNGRIRETADPLWIGGSHPYGEYFHGLIDEVRVYDHALDRQRLRSEMAIPIARGSRPTTRGLIAAWGFDHGSGRWAADASREGNRGRLIGASWASRGRYGAALRFDGAGSLVRVPASPTLDVDDALTISAWVRPERSRSGWRTVLHRQTDAYFLMAGGAPTAAGASDHVRVGLVVAAALCFCLALLRGRARWLEVSATWWPPLALFLAGSALDVWLGSPGTVIGPALVAIWYAFTARRRIVAASMLALTALLTGVTFVALSGQTWDDLARAGGGVARSAALGLVLVVCGLLAVRSGPGYG